MDQRALLTYPRQRFWRTLRVEMATTCLIAVLVGGLPDAAAIAFAAPSVLWSAFCVFALLAIRPDRHDRGLRV